MDKLEERINNLKQTFELLDDWIDQYTYLVTIAPNYPRNDFEANDVTKIKGCQSVAYLNCITNDKGYVRFEVKSDSLIIQGLLGIIADCFTDLKAEEIVGFEGDFLEILGIKDNFTSTRTTGITSAILEMKKYSKMCLREGDNNGKFRIQKY